MWARDPGGQWWATTRYEGGKLCLRKLYQEMVLGKYSIRSIFLFLFRKFAVTATRFIYSRIFPLFIWKITIEHIVVTIACLAPLEICLHVTNF